MTHGWIEHTEQYPGWRNNYKPDVIGIEAQTLRTFGVEVKGEV